MLQNIHIAAGPIPAETGDLQHDMKELRNYIEALLHALERNFDLIDRSMGGEKNA